MRSKYTFIHKDIHDFRRPIEVDPFYVERLRKTKEITKKEYEQAKKGQEIIAMGYRLVMKLPTKIKKYGNKNTSSRNARA